MDDVVIFIGFVDRAGRINIHREDSFIAVYEAVEGECVLNSVAGVENLLTG